MIGSWLMTPMERQTQNRIQSLSNLRDDEFDDFIEMRNVQNNIDMNEIERAIKDENEELLNAANHIPDEVINEANITEELNYLNEMTLEEIDELYNVNIDEQ